MAIPSEVQQRSAPEERAAVCASLDEARQAGRGLARELAADVAARGNVLVTDERPQRPASPASSPPRPVQ